MKALGKLKDLAALQPRTVKSGPCQEVVQTGADIDLGALPILQCWPLDAGRFITLPLVFTKHPVTGRRNVGMYRLQVYDRDTTGMHWHIHKDGAEHFRVAAEQAAGRRMAARPAAAAAPRRRRPGRRRPHGSGGGHRHRPGRSPTRPRRRCPAPSTR